MDITKIKEQILQNNFIPKLLLFYLGVFLLALNYNLFLLPNNLVIGGTSGLSIVFSKTFGWNPTFFLYISSIVLILLSFLTLGIKNTGISIVGSFIYPFMITFTEPLANILMPYVQFDSILITVIVTAITYGIATGIIYKVGFDTGGSDILMKIVNKYAHIQEGKSILIVNGLIILLGGFVFGINQVIYAIIILIIYSRIVDSILIGISNSKLFFIYTKEHKKIRKFIIEEMNTGVTLLESHGGYSGEKGIILMCVVPTRDYYMFKETVLLIDPNAFFIIHDCYEVQGGKRRTIPFV